MSNTTNIMIVGVGGQGTLLASRILGNAIISQGYDVKLSEVHGMSQRGGSVVTYVKFGEKFYSPIIDMGEADIILAFEKLEAYRYLPYLKKGGVLITNDREINPMPVVMGKAEYPRDLEKYLNECESASHCKVHTFNTSINVIHSANDIDILRDEETISKHICITWVKIRVSFSRY